MFELSVRFTDELKEIEKTCVRISKNNGSDGNYVQLNAELFTSLPKFVWNIVNPRLLLNLALQHDLGLVNISSLVKLIQKKSWLIKTKKPLDKLSQKSVGYLDESELKHVISIIIGRISKIKNKIFFQLYTEYVVQVIFFYLSSQSNKLIKIVDLLGSGILQDYYEMIENDASELQNDSLVRIDYFSIIYFEFMKYKSVNDGLTKDELNIIFNKDVSSAFWRQFVYKYGSKDGLIKFPEFIKLRLAFKSPTEYKSLKFFFSILDIHSRGFINVENFIYFTKSHVRRVNWEMKHNSVEFAKSISQNESGWLLNFSITPENQLLEKGLEGFYYSLYDLILMRSRQNITFDHLVACRAKETELFIMRLLKYSYFEEFSDDEYYEDEDDDDDEFLKLNSTITF